MKRLKDPIYGYIEIDDDLFDLIIDTPEFQRLRGVTQTSYAPLYASAVHNRFIHSLGVFHLGKIFSESISKTKRVTKLERNLLNKYLPVFNYACLLHDVGHAPFSHTGEHCFLDAADSRKPLHNLIIELTKDLELEQEISDKNYKAAPHELMSVIVSLKCFSDIFHDNDERSFFARCILGYSYVSKEKDKSFLNCLISILNSSIIDVDKLDYLIRDAFITGYDTVSIDYKRLLKSIRIVNKDGLYKVVYTQASISVIEDVVYAHDSERKWIQNHPVVQYDAFLLQHAIEVIRYKHNDLFAYDALSKRGVSISDNYKVSLISDSDIIFLMKNYINNDQLIEEYFDRKNRRHPLWKSEAEFKAIFNKGFSEQAYEIIESRLSNLSKYLLTANSSIIMNQSTLEGLQNDIKASKEACKTADKKSKKNLIAANKEKEKLLKLLKCFQSFAKEQKIEFDFIILFTKRFNSGFVKVDFDKVEIEFSSLQSIHHFKKVANTLSASKSERDNYFYVYYKRQDRKKRIDVARMAELLNLYAVDEVYKSE